MGVGTHFLPLNLHKNADISIFSKQEKKKGIFLSQSSLEFYIQKSKHIYKDLKTTW